MKILGAGLALADQTDAALRYASDHACKAARAALAMARCLPSELDLIVSLSVSPNRIADARNMAGPRLCHPVQRELRASNAMAFDLLDADWVFALDVAESHCRAMNYRRALVVRAESLGDVDGAAESGLADGGGAIVMTVRRDEPCHVSHGDLKRPPLVTLGTLTSRQMHDSGRVARAQGDYNAATGAFPRPEGPGAALEFVVNGVLDSTTGPVDHLFHESWMAGWLSCEVWCRGTRRIALARGAREVPASFQLPHWLAGRIASAATPSNAAVLTLDVFKPRIACMVLEF